MLVLVGESGSGKSEIEKRLRDNYGFKKIVSYTTRSMREGEVDGEDYHFISSENFVNMRFNGDFAECVSYNGNSYSIHKEDCLDDTVVVVEPSGLEQLLEVKGLNVISFYIKASMFTRGWRMFKRGDKIKNIIKRLKIDKKIFIDISKNTDYTINNNKNLKILILLACVVIEETYKRVTEVVI